MRTSSVPLSKGLLFVQLLLASCAHALSMPRRSMKFLQKRSGYDINAEAMMKKADQKRWPVSGPVPEINTATRQSVDKWANRAMQAIGLDNEGIQGQVHYYEAKVARMEAQGDVTKAQKANRKLESWQKEMTQRAGPSADLIVPMRQKAQQKIEHHQQVLANIDLGPLYDSLRSREYRKVEKWQNKDKIFTGRVGNMPLKDASWWADEYHLRRIASGRTAKHFRKLHDEEPEKHRQGTLAEYEGDHLQNQEKATQRWLRWRAIVGK